MIEVENLIYDVYRGSKAASFEANKANVIKDYRLSEEERGAVLNQDYPLLYDMGVHPMLCMYLARANGHSVPAYLGMISDRPTNTKQDD